MTTNLPHNFEAEKSVLGGVILNNTILQEIPELEVDDFYDLRNKAVFSAIRELEASKRPIDVVTIEDHLDRAGRVEAVGGFSYLGVITLSVPTPDNVVAYAKIVRTLARNRRTIEVLSSALRSAQSGALEASEVLSETIGELQRVEQVAKETDHIPVITIRDAMDELERLAKTPIFELPFPELNRALGFGGCLAGQVYYLAGGTGFGKTSFIATIVRAIASQGRAAIIAFYEMFSGYYAARMAAAHIGVHANRILRGDVARETVESAIPDGIEMLEEPSMLTLRRLADRYVRTGRGAPFIVVDYVQLLGDRILATMSRPDARLANAQASAGLRQLAKDTGAVVLAVSAAGRSASKKLSADVRKVPARDLIDASRESGSIEFDGAGVMVLSVSDDKDCDENIATISVAKARFGQTMHIDARYDGRTGLWREIGCVVPAVKVTAKPDDGSLSKSILDALRKNGPVSSKSKILKLTGGNRTAVFSEIDVLMETDQIVTSRAGYLLPEQASELAKGPRQTVVPGAES
jgi:replicative DNA helicase